MKFRCTLVVDLEIPAETEDNAADVFIGVVGTAIATSGIFPQESIKLVKHEAVRRQET